MTREEAEEAKDVLMNTAWMGTDNGAKVFDAIEIASEALDKQTPRKPALSGDGYADGEIVYDIWECPNCGVEYEIDYDGMHKFCPNCGQAIDWSVEDIKQIESKELEAWDGD